MLYLAIQCLCDDPHHHLRGQWTPLLLWLVAMVAGLILAMWVGRLLGPTRAPGLLPAALAAGRPQQTLRCPFCHDAIRPARLEPAVRCSACGVQPHAECAREHGGCSVLGCRREGRARREATARFS